MIPSQRRVGVGNTAISFWELEIFRRSNCTMSCGNFLLGIKVLNNVSLLCGEKFNFDNLG